MGISFLHGQGSVICDGVDAGLAEFSIGGHDEGLDVNRRGKLWGNKQAIAAAMAASDVQLSRADNGETYLLDIEDLDRDGGAFFSILPLT